MGVTINIKSSKTEPPKPVYIFCLESEADRLAMYGMMGDQSDEEDTMYDKIGEQSDEEPDRSDEDEENIATSDDDESDDGNNEISGRFVLFDLILYIPSTIFQLNRDGSSWFEPVLI